MTVDQIKLVGGFGRNTLNCQQEQSELKPVHFQWYYGPESRPITFYLEQTMFEDLDTKTKRVGMLVETRELRPHHYEKALQRAGEFDLILTHDMSLIMHGPPFFYFPLGGSFIKNWGLFPKRKLASIMPGTKDFMTGHKLRHKAVELIGEYYNESVDVIKSPFKSKADGLREYMFSIVIENAVSPGWFTEKLIDCLSQGTIPVYWGSREVVQSLFDARGIIFVEDIEELAWAINGLSPDKYYRMSQFSDENMRIARKYACTEDWIWDHYLSRYY